MGRQKFIANNLGMTNSIIIIQCSNSVTPKKILERGSGVDQKFNFLNRCSDGRSETADAKIYRNATVLLFTCLIRRSNESRMNSLFLAVRCLGFFYKNSQPLLFVCPCVPPQLLCRLPTPSSPCSRSEFPSAPLFISRTTSTFQFV
jgi:hypothetical protein